MERRVVLRSVAVVVFSVLVLAAWIALAPRSSTVIAQGTLKVDSQHQTVQLDEGGIAREVHLRDGQRVNRGDSILVLEDTTPTGEVNRLGLRIRAQRAILARLEAQQRISPALKFPSDLLSAADGDELVLDLLKKERAVFAVDREALTKQVGLLRMQRQKVAKEMTALDAQIEQANVSLELREADRERHRALLKEGFISPGRISQIDAGIADHKVRIEEKRAELARAEQHLIDIDLRLQALETEYRQRASDELKVATARLVELEQELRESGAAGSRHVVAAPVSGRGGPR